MLPCLPTLLLLVEFLLLLVTFFPLSFQQLKANSIIVKKITCVDVYFCCFVDGGGRGNVQTMDYILLDNSM